MAAGAAGLGGWAVWQRIGDEPRLAAGPSSTVGATTPVSTIDASTATPTTAVPTTTTARLSPVLLEVIERDGWGARPAATEYVSHSIDRLTVHHTAVVLDSNREAVSRLRGHQAYHQEQGWPDLAYHFAIDRQGNVYEARPYSAQGDTFTNYDPTGHFLPVLEGDYDQQVPADAQLDSLVLLLAWAAGEFAVDPATIGGHRDYAATTCPGDNVYALLADGTVFGRVTDVLEAGGVELAFLRGEAAAARVAEIEA